MRFVNQVSIPSIFRSVHLLPPQSFYITAPVGSSDSGEAQCTDSCGYSPYGQCLTETADMWEDNQHMLFQNEKCENNVVQLKKASWDSYNKMEHTRLAALNCLTAMEKTCHPVKKETILRLRVKVKLTEEVSYLFLPPSLTCLPKPLTLCYRTSFSGTTPDERLYISNEQ